MNVLLLFLLTVELLSSSWLLMWLLLLLVVVLAFVLRMRLMPDDENPCAFLKRADAKLLLN